MKKIIAYIALIASVSIWSISFVSIGMTLKQLSPGEINVIRFSLASIALILIQLSRKKKLALHRRDVFPIIISGLLGTTVYYYFENLSLQYLSPAAVSTLTGSIPVLTIVIAMLFLGYKTRMTNVVAIFLSFAGIIVLSYTEPSVQMVTLKGVIFIMIGNIGWVVYTLMNQKLNRKYDKLQLLTLQMIAGTIAFYLLYLFELQIGVGTVLRWELILTSRELMIHLLFLGLGASALAYYLYNYALSEVGFTLSSLFINVIPVMTLVVSVSVEAEELTFSKVLGCLLVVIAVYVIDEKSSS